MVDQHQNADKGRLVFAGAEPGLETIRNNQRVLGDKKLFLTVLSELIENALKFSPKGAVQLFLSRLPKASPEGKIVWYQVAVEDHGPGLPEGAGDFLFAPFRQLDGSTTRSFGGIGLGLASCRKMVELLGGQIGLEKPSTHEGTRAWFRLPFEEVAGKPPEAAPFSSAPGPSGSLTFSENFHFLIVEDHPENAHIAKILLEKAGAQTTVAMNGPEALDVCLTDSFDMILLDLEMPGLDGVETAQAIRKQCALNDNTPMAILSAHPKKDHHGRCEASGIAVYLEKPLIPANFIGELQSILEKS
jgi:CheY-like chemotaxis protein